MPGARRQFWWEVFPSLYLSFSRRRAADRGEILLRRVCTEKSGEDLESIKVLFPKWDATRHKGEQSECFRQGVEEHCRLPFSGTAVKQVIALFLDETPKAGEPLPVVSGWAATFIDLIDPQWNGGTDGDGEQNVRRRVGYLLASTMVLRGGVVLLC